jgi:hypothetical protein
MAEDYSGAGSRIRLVSTTDSWTEDLRAGCEGTLLFTDEVGTVHVAWDNGSRLGLIPGEDQWEVLSGPVRDIPAQA